MRTVTLALTLLFAGAGLQRAVRVLTTPAPVSFSWDFGAIPPHSFATVGVGLPGARRGELCVSSTPAEFTAATLVTACSVEADDTATVRVFNVGSFATDPPRASFNVAIVR